MRRLTEGSIALILLLVLAHMAWAQVPQESRPPVQPHPVGHEAIDQLKSPYCPGMMLEVCPSPQAAFLRDSIHALAAEGLSADSLVAWMLANHGEEWRAVPEARGKGLLAWAIPPAALVLGLLLTVAVLHRFKSGHPEPQRAPGGLTPEEEARLARALEELKDSEETPF